MECPNSDGKLCSIPDTAEGSLKLISIKDAEGTFVWDYRKDVCASYSNISDTKGYRKQCREQYNSCTQGIWVQHGCARLDETYVKASVSNCPNAFATESHNEGCSLAYLLT